MSLEYDAKWSDSLGVIITVETIYSGLSHWDHQLPPCPFKIEYLDGNNSRTGSYPRLARVTADNYLHYGRPFCFLSSPGADPLLRYKGECALCEMGGFPLYMDFNVDRESWALLFREMSKDQIPSERDRWNYNFQKTHNPISFVEFCAQGQQQAFHADTTIDSEILYLGSPSWAHKTQPPVVIPEAHPDIFKLGKQPRKLEGETK